MPVYTDISFYLVDPATIFSTVINGTATYTGPATADGLATITDNEAGIEGQTLDDDSAGLESATADVTVGANTSIGSTVDAELSWTLRDTVTGETFQVVQFQVELGTAAGSYLLSEMPLVSGRIYQTLDYNTNPDATVGAPAFNYLDYASNWTPDPVDGTAGDDSMGIGYTDGDGDQITAGADSVLAGDGNDSVLTGDGNDTIYGGAGNDTIGDFSTQFGDDSIYGEAGDDSLNGGFGNDYVEGGIGNDTLTGSAGSDTLIGGDGYDYFSVTDDHDYDLISGGAGAQDYDVVGFFNWLTTSAVDVVFTGDEEGTYDFRDAGATAYGSFSDIEMMMGTEFSDSFDLSASTAHQQILGLGGDDTITGGAGDDSVDGGAGNDLIDGGAGNDTLLGGTGNDTIYGGFSGPTASSPVSINSSNYTDTTSGYTVTAQNVVGGVRTAASVANVADGGGWIGAGGTVSDTDSGVQQQTAYDLASGVSETLIVDFDAPIDSLTFTTYSLQTASFGEVGHYDLYNGGVLVGSADFTDSTGTGNDTFTVSGFGDFDQIVFSALIQTDLTDGSDYGISDITFTPTSTGAGAAGNDSIDGGDGDDVLYGEEGDDTILGGAGNDSIVGGQATADADLNLSWISQAVSGTDISAGFTQDTGGINVAVSFTNDTGNATAFQTSNSTQYVNSGAGETFATTSALYLAGGATTGDTSTTTIDFSAVGGSGYGDEVTNVSFRVNDLDQSGWEDIITIRAYDADGNLLTTTLTYQGATTTGTAPTEDGEGSYAQSDALGSMLVEISGNVSYFEIDYDQAGTAGQALWVSDIHFTAIGQTDGNDSLVGGAGDDTIFGDAGNDILLGGDGDDSMEGGVGNDTITVGYGDTGVGGDGADTFILTEADTSSTASTEFRVDGSTGGLDVDTLDLTGWAAYRNLSEVADGDGDSTTGTIEVQDSGGIWHVVNFYEIENIILPADYIVEGTSGADTIDASYTGDPEGDMIDNGDGNPLTPGVGDSDSVIAGGGADIVYAQAGNDTVFGEAGADTISGAAGNDSMDGGTENDVVLGGTGNDTLIGGTGDDTLRGENEWIDLSANASGAGVTATNLTIQNVSQDSVDLYWIDNSGTMVFYATVQPGETYVQPTFEEHNWVLTNSEFYYTQLIEGAANQTITFDDATMADQLYGGDGNDSLYGEWGNDSIYGGTGEDFVYAGVGDDVVQGDDGNDTISGDEGNDTLDGGANNDTVVGGSGSDSITGGTGDDAVWGDNIYLDPSLFPSGTSGSATTLSVTNAADGPIELWQIDSTGTLVFVTSIAAGATTNQAILSDENFVLRDPDGYYLEFIEGDENLSITYGDEGLNDTINGGDGNDTLDGMYGNDSIWAGSGNDSIIGGTGDDTVFGADGSDTILGGDGNDSLDGDDAAATGAADSIDGGAGNDVIVGDIGDDTLLGGSGNDTIYGGVDNDQIDGGAGIDVIFGETGNDTVLGGDGADTIYGGAGNDVLNANIDSGRLWGDSGNDTLTVEGGTIVGTVHGQTGDDLITVSNATDASGFVTGGDGNDTINIVDSTIGNIYGSHESGNNLGGAGYDTYNISGASEINKIWVGYSDNPSGGFDVVNISDTALVDDIEIIDQNTNINITGSGALGDGSGNVNWGSAWSGEQNLTVTDSGSVNIGGTLDLGAGNDSAVFSLNASVAGNLAGGAGNDTISFTGSSTITGWIDGGAGNDSIDGGISSTNIYGGTGNDTINAGGGDDTITLADNFGDDIIVGGETGETNGDTLEINTTTATTIDLTSADPEAGTVTSGASTATFSEIENIQLGGARETIVLADGSGADSVIDFDMTDSGDGSTNDQLDVSGLTDANGAIVNTGDVTVTDDGSGNAVLTFPGGESITLIGVAPAQLATSAQLASIGIPEPDYIVEGTGVNDLIDGSYTGDPEGDVVDANDHSDGSNDDSIQGGAGLDTIYGGLGNDTIDGGDGRDWLYGEAGNDSIYGGNTAEQDLIYGGDGNDTIDAGLGDDYLYGGAGDDSLIGGGGLDFYYGGDGSDTIVGGDDLEWVSGDAGNDLISGGLGNDDLSGGTGSDTITGDGGNDTISGDNVWLDYWLYYSGTSGTPTTMSVTNNADGPVNLFKLESDGTYTSMGVIQAGDTLSFGALSDENFVLTDTVNSNFLAVIEGEENLSYTYATETMNDSLSGGVGDDSILGHFGADTIDGGLGADTLLGGSGADTISGGEGADSIDGGSEDDVILLADNFGSDTIIGGETGETNGDTLDLSATTTGVTVDLTSNDPEAGTVSDGTSTATFSEIENIVLGGGRDTIVLADGSGADTVQAFDMTDSGDGTTNDQLDVSGLTSDGGTTPVNTADVVVTDTNGDGTGDAILTFPGGESITLVGVLASQVDSPAELEAIGIPGTDIVDGTSGNDNMPVGFVDAEGDIIDGADGLNDTIYGYDGNDTINAGAGDDYVDAGTGGDRITDGTGNDTILGGDGYDRATLVSSGGDDLLTDVETVYVQGDAGNDTLSMTTGSGSVGLDESWNLSFTDGQNAVSTDGTYTLNLTNYYEFDAFAATNTLDASNAGQNIWYHNYGSSDTVTGSDFDDSIYNYGSTGANLYDGGLGDDYIEGGRGGDTIYGGDGNDQIVGDNGANTIGSADYIDLGAGNDTVWASGGADTILGGTGDDVINAHGDGDFIILEDNFGNDTIWGGETFATGTDDDTLDLSLVTQNLTVDLSANDPEAGTVSNGTDTATFAEIENIVLGGGRDTIVLADGSGADTVQGFDLTDSGDGTTNDQLDVSGLTSDGGTTPVHAGDVVVTDTNGDGTGDAILTFPGGESITLVGVLSSQVDSIDELVALGIPDARDFVVEGTTGDDSIGLTYTGDPEGDMVDSGDNATGTNDDVIDAGAGNDSIEAGAGNDSVLAGTGNDTIWGGNDAGADTLDGGDGDDLINGQAGADSILGGAGNDSIAAGSENDTVLGGTGNDSVNGGTGNDSIDGGAGNDLLDGADGNDTVLGGLGNDTIYASGGDDTLSGGDDQDVFVVSDGAGNDVIDGGAGGVDVDTIDLSALSTGFNVVYSGDDAGTIDTGTETITFTEIERLILSDQSSSVDGGADTQWMEVVGGAGDDTITAGSGTDTLSGNAGNDSLDAGAGDDSIDGGAGNDTLIGSAGNDTLTGGDGRDLFVLADGSGADTISDFDLTDSGDGTTIDQLDVSGLTDAGGNPVSTEDVTVSDTNGDGTGDAILTFPGGESITLVGVLASQVNDPAELEAIGIPAAGGNFVVDGTAGNDTINLGYLGDPEGDLIDNNDHSDGSNDDVVQAGAGNDAIDAGIGNDTIFGGAGDDEIFLDGSIQDDSIIGGETGETQGDRINFSTVADDITITFTGDEAGTLTDGVSTTTFSEIERFQMGTGSDTVIGSDGAEEIIGNFGNDSIIAGGGNDTIYSGFDDDYVEGGAGNDSLVASSGADTVAGGTGDDQINVGPADGEVDVVVLNDGDGNDIVTDFEGPTDLGGGAWGGNDQLDVSGLTDASGNPVSTEDVTVTDDGSGNAVLTFPDGTSVLMAGIDPVNASDPNYLAAMGIPLFTGDFIVEGTTGGDLIDGAYLGDPEGDMIDNNDHSDGSNDDLVTAGAGDDTVLSAAGNDTVGGDTGNDSIDGGAGNDSLSGGDDNDIVLGGTGDDWVSGNAGNDSVYGGAGNDTMLGEGGDDVFNIEDGFGVDTITGGETGETIGDALDASAVTANTTLDLTAGTAGDPESGTLTSGTDTVSFAEIESIKLGAGADTVTGSAGNDSVSTGTGADVVDGGAGNDVFDLGGADGAVDTVVFGSGDGADTISGFEAPTDNGDGTFTGHDQFDLSTLIDAQGDPVNVWDVTVTDSNGDGTGDAILSFPNGETITLAGVLASQIDSALELQAAGIPCFTSGTLIKTVRGEVPVEELEVGDLVLTRDNGYQPIRWAGKRVLSGADLERMPHLNPIQVRAGALGNGLPERDMRVSPQHRMMIANARTVLWFGEEEVLAAAKHLTIFEGIDEVTASEGITYYHIMFDNHEIVVSDGAWTESFQPGDQTLGALGHGQRTEIFTLFPELASETGRAAYASARVSIRAHDAALLLKT